MNNYQITLPDGRIKSKNSKLDLAFAVVYLEVGKTEWDSISWHSTYEIANKRKTTLWTRNIKGGRNASKNWITAIQVVSVRKVGA